MAVYDRVLIYYFSGTGNSKHVVQWISEVASEKKISVELIDIANIDRKNIAKPPADALIGFCSPTHGFNYPPVMLHFILRFPGSVNNKVFLMNTRAGVKLYKIFLPGLSGAALLLSSVVLLLKGYRIVGMRPIDLPSNWISIHPAVVKKAVESMYVNYKKVTKRFANKILDGKKDYRALLDLPLDIIPAIFSPAYYCFGRFFFAKSFFASSKCNNCGICIKQCPVKAIVLVDNRPFWSFRCESCMHCMNICPERAIETAHGFIIGLMILLSTIFQSFVYVWLLRHNINWFSDEIRYSFLWRMLLETIVMFAALWISYRLVHYLRRFKIFDWIITYTSLTKFKFWGRYKPPKESNLI